ncbi:hypothetical protein GCM10027421_04900 [Microbacterium shaanxiense]
MSDFEADVIIPVHTATRPIARAAASALDHNDRRVRVNVVAHNIDAQLIRRELGEYAGHPSLRLLHLMDGIGSPAGPLNHGISVATANYYAVLGSDDEFEPGAVDSWLAMAERTDADAVLARVNRSIQGVEPLPPTRRGRETKLSGARDRLTYRCVPQGLISRERFGHLRFTPGLASGEDQEFTAQLWFTAHALAYDRHGPAYVLHEEGDDRVTATARPVDEDFRFLEVVGATTWYPRLRKSQKRAWGVKNLRMHLMDAVAARLDDLDSHAVDLVRVADTIERLSPGATALLARCDRDVLHELRTPRPDPARIREAFAKRWGRNADAWLPANPLLALHPQAPYPTLRAMIA